MTRRRPTPDPHRPSGAERALEELCVTHGYCLAPDDQDTILQHLPANPDAFLDAVLLAEGRDPRLITKQERRPMVEIVARLAYGDA